MLEQSRYLSYLTFSILWMMCSCSQQTASTTHLEHIESASKTDHSYFRHRWWNYYKRGLSAAENKLFDEAVADLLAAIGQRPCDQRMARTYGMHFIDYFPNREIGIIYYERGKVEKAKDCLLRSIEHDPSAKAYFFLDRARRVLIDRLDSFIPPPVISLDVENHELWTREDPIWIRGKVSDPHFIVGIKINDRPVAMDHSKTFFTFKERLSLAQGRHQIKISAVNLGGKVASRSVIVNVDRNGPLIALENIRPIRDMDGKLCFALSGNLIDPSGIASVLLNNEPLTIDPKEKQPFLYRTPAKIDIVHMVVEDRLGNRTEASISMDVLSSPSPSPLLAARHLELHAGLLRERDGTPPTIELKSLRDLETVFMDKIFLDGVIKDVGNIVEIIINGESIDLMSTRMVFFNRVIPLKKGTNKIVVTATDTSGNRAEKAIEIFRRVPEAFQLDSRLKLSVVPFERLSIGDNVPDLFQEYLIDSLVNQNRFRVVERSRLDVILQEQHLSASTLVDRQKAIKIGRLAAAQSVIVGNIIASRRGTEVVSRMIDTETSDILATVDVFGETRDQVGLSELAEGMALKYHREFPLSGGEVISIDGDTITTDLGQEEIKLLRRIIIFSENTVRHPISHQVLGTDKRILCHARISEVQATISKAVILETPENAIEIRHKVVAE